MSKLITSVIAELGFPEASDYSGGCPNCGYGTKEMVSNSSVCPFCGADNKEVIGNSLLKPYIVDVYHKGEHVGSEALKARDYNHAHRLGAYIAPTMAREAVHPTEFDKSRVSHTVTDPSEGEHDFSSGRIPSQTANTKEETNESEKSISPETLEKAGFVRFPPEVAKGSSGARCSTCKYDKNGICHYNDKLDLRGLKVDSSTCCNYWDHPGTKKGEEAVHNSVDHGTPGEGPDWQVDGELWNEVQQIMPKGPLENISLPHCLGTIGDGVKIVLVDGNHVMLKHDMDFVVGASGTSSPEFIPANEIWLDANVAPSELPFNAYHEAHERRLMANHGMKYERANERANAAEKVLRRRADLYSQNSSTGELGKSLNSLGEEESDGLIVWVNPKEKKALINSMDWHEGDGARKIGKVAERLFGKDNVEYTNERSPEGDGWIKLNSSSLAENIWSPEAQAASQQARQASSEAHQATKQFTSQVPTNHLGLPIGEAPTLDKAKERAGLAKGRSNIGAFGLAAEHHVAASRLHRQMYKQSTDIAERYKHRVAAVKHWVAAKANRVAAVHTSLRPPVPAKAG